MINTEVGKQAVNKQSSWPHAVEYLRFAGSKIPTALRIMLVCCNTGAVLARISFTPRDEQLATIAAAINEQYSQQEAIGSTRASSNARHEPVPSAQEIFSASKITFPSWGLPTSVN